MKKIVYIYILLIMGISACTDDVLDKKPLDIISEEAVWSEAALIDAYLNHCYDEISFINDVEYSEEKVGSRYTREWFSMETINDIGDECTYGWSPKSGGKFTNQRVDKDMNPWWAYPLVRKLNIFIENVPGSPLDDALKVKRTAEARFLRAFAYFNMVKRYGGVPLITKAQSIDDSQEELYRSRDKEVEIYDFVLTELDAIVNDLADAKYDEGRPTRYAALALQSRAAMYAASIAQWGEVKLDGLVGIPANRATDYWNKSYDASMAIINSGVFELYNGSPNDKAMNFRNIFMDENNSEVIFAEEFDGASGKAHSRDLLSGPFGYNAWGLGGQAVAYLETVETFENVDGTSGIIDRQKIADGYLWTSEELFGNKDPRFHGTILTQGSTWLGNKLDVYKGIITEDGTITETDYKGIRAKGKNYSSRQFATPFMMAKYIDESMGIAPGPKTSQSDWIVFRLGEILLNHAEAAMELGKENEALVSVNKLRERAGIILLDEITVDEIRHERRVELLYETHRYWDLRRWRTAEVELSKPLSSMRFILDYNTRKFKLEIIENHDGLPTPKFVPRYYYMPITIARTTNNPNLVENPDYQ